MTTRIVTAPWRVLRAAACVGLAGWLATCCGCGQDDGSRAVGSKGAAATTTETEDNAARTTAGTRRKKSKRLTRKLSDFHLFRGNQGDLRPAEGVLAYDLNSSLFVDYARAQRVIFVPPGKAVAYHASNCFEFPAGSVIAKTLYYPADMADPTQGRRNVETRVLLRRKTDWLALGYLWNDDQTDADLAIAGARVEVSWRDHDGSTRSNTHIVPNANDCKRCHKNEVVGPIGLTARNLNRDFAYAGGVENQLDHMTRSAWLRGAPHASEAPRLAVWDDAESGTLDARARSWLEVNCSHCHNPIGPAKNSGLYLRANVETPYRYGVFKSPVAAGHGSGGRSYDIVPGKPDESILLFRLEATEPRVLMPEYGRLLVHAESATLIRQWIAEMEPPEGQNMAKGIGEFQSLSPEELAKFVNEVAQNGDAARGETVLHRSQLTCLKCHAIGGVGGRVGPDLIELQPKKTVEYLVQSVLLPNKEIKKGFETLVVVTDKGQVFSGIKVDETPSELVLRDLTRDEIRVARDAIEEQEAGVSLMPANAAAMLGREEFVDLVRFLSEVGKGDLIPRNASGIVRKWQVLDPVPSHAENADPNDFIASAATSGELIWETAYSHVSGELRLPSTSPTAAPSRCWVRCEIDVLRPGALAIALNSAEGVSMWLDGRPVEIDEQTVLNVQAGRRTLAFMITLESRTTPSLRCEVTGGSESPAVVRMVE